jgi:hypothetical protein
VELTDTEHLGWGPKTADPGPDKVYPSKKLHEVINVDLLLEVQQLVVEQNQAAFGLDR